MSFVVQISHFHHTHNRNNLRVENIGRHQPKLQRFRSQRTPSLCPVEWHPWCIVKWEAELVSRRCWSLWQIPLVCVWRYESQSCLQRSLLQSRSTDCGSRLGDWSRYSSSRLFLGGRHGIRVRSAFGRVWRVCYRIHRRGSPTSLQGRQCVWYVEGSGRSIPYRWWIGRWFVVFASFGTALPGIAFWLRLDSSHDLVSVCSHDYKAHFLFPHWLVVLGQLRDVAVNALESFSRRCVGGWCFRGFEGLGRTEVSGVLVRVGGRWFRGIGGLGDRRGFWKVVEL